MWSASSYKVDSRVSLPRHDTFGGRERKDRPGRECRDYVNNEILSHERTHQQLNLYLHELMSDGKIGMKDFNVQDFEQEKNSRLDWTNLWKPRINLKFSLMFESFKVRKNHELFKSTSKNCFWSQAQNSATTLTSTKKVIKTIFLLYDFFRNVSGQIEISHTKKAEGFDIVH